MGVSERESESWDALAGGSDVVDMPVDLGDRGSAGGSDVMVVDIGDSERRSTGGPNIGLWMVRFELVPVDIGERRDCRRFGLKMCGTSRGRKFGLFSSSDLKVILNDLVVDFKMQNSLASANLKS